MKIGLKYKDKKCIFTKEKRKKKVLFSFSFSLKSQNISCQSNSLKLVKESI